MPNRYTVMKRAPITESERGAPDIFRRLTGLARLYTISSALSQIPHKILVDSPDGGYGCRKGTSGVASSRQRRNRLKLVISTFWAIYRIPAVPLIRPLSQLGGIESPVLPRSDTRAGIWNNGINPCALLYRLYMALKVQKSETNCIYFAGVSLCPDTR